MATPSSIIIPVKLEIDDEQVDTLTAKVAELEERLDKLVGPILEAVIVINGALSQPALKKFAAAFQETRSSGGAI